MSTSVTWASSKGGVPRSTFYLQSFLKNAKQKGQRYDKWLSQVRLSKGSDCQEYMWDLGTPYIPIVPIAVVLVNTAMHTCIVS